MQDVRELYIYCEPIETKIGSIRFFKVEEYPKLAPYVPLIFIEKRDLMQLVDKKYKNIFKQISLLSAIKFFSGEVLPLYQLYKELFILCFEEDVFDEIEDDGELLYYLDLIRKMNCLTYDKPSSNPEIEKFNQYERMLKKAQGGTVDFESVYTSVWLATGERPINMYIYEMYALFNRQGAFFEYMTTALYQVFSEKINISPWCESIDILKETNKNETKFDDFRNKSSNMFK